MHGKLPQSTVKRVLPSNESHESKTGCNRTLATVLWVPLSDSNCCDFKFQIASLTNFCAPFFKEIPFFFFCVVTPSKTLAAPQPLTIVFSLGNGGVLRSQEGEGFRKEGGGGDGKKRRKKGRAKSAKKWVGFELALFEHLRTLFKWPH